LAIRQPDRPRQQRQLDRLDEYVTRSSFIPSIGPRRRGLFCALGLALLSARMRQPDCPDVQPWQQCQLDRRGERFVQGRHRPFTSVVAEKNN
jgi:hypothetical protein